MSNIDWITWKTNPKELLNVESIEDKLIECFQEYNTYMNPVVYEQIKHEVYFGGLDKETLSIMGITPANEMGIDILNCIDEIKTIYNNLKEKILEQAKEQRDNEKQQLIKKIEEKISIEKSLLNKIITSKAIKGELIDLGENPEEIVEIINNRISKLNERLEIAKSI